LRNAIKKLGFWYVYLRILGMYSILPAWRHTFSTNPYLFRYQLYLTNQETNSGQYDLDTMCKVAFAYIFEPGYILRASKSRARVKHELQQIGFVPNYSNDLEDVNMENFDNLGLQVGEYFSLLIFLETVAKTPAGLHHNVTSNKVSETVMHSDHPMYADMKALGLEPQYHVPCDSLDRFSLVELTLPYDHFYHLVCCVKVRTRGATKRPSESHRGFPA
jgi:hypothetical protein